MVNAMIYKEGNVLKCDTCGRLVGRVRSTGDTIPKQDLGLEFMRYRAACPSCGKITCVRCAKGRLLCESCLNLMSNGAYQRVVEYRRKVMMTVKKGINLGLSPWLLGIVVWVPLYVYVMSPNLNRSLASTIFMVGIIVIAIWGGWFIFNWFKGGILLPVLFKKIISTALTRGEQVLTTLLDSALYSPKNLYHVFRHIKFQQLANADDLGTYLKDLLGG